MRAFDVAYLDNSTRSSDGDVDERADADGFVRPRSDTGAAHGNGDHGGALGAPRPLALHAPDELNGYLVSRRATTLGLRYHPWTVGSSWETLSALSLGATRSPKGGNRHGLAEFAPDAWQTTYTRCTRAHTAGTCRAAPRAVLRGAATKAAY